jgi:hypothetical protein
MKEFIESLLERRSLFIISVGVVLLLVGIAQEISISTFSLQITDAIGKWILSIVGIFVIVFGAFLAYKEANKEGYSQENSHIEKTTKPKYEFLNEEPVEFLGELGNRFPINSDFLDWEKATVLLWVKIPPLGQGLRDNKSNKYILAHNTGVDHERGWPYNNRFSLGRFLDPGYWAVTISRNNAEEEKEQTLGFDDHLEPGWHQFMISWDRSKKNMEFIIDGSFTKKEFAPKDMLNHWPVQLTGKVYVGAWTTDWENFYCDTFLYLLEIFDDFLDTDSKEVKEHKRKKPRS